MFYSWKNANRAFEGWFSCQGIGLWSCEVCSSTLCSASRAAHREPRAAPGGSAILPPARKLGELLQNPSDFIS